MKLCMIMAFVLCGVVSAYTKRLPLRSRNRLSPGNNVAFDEDPEVTLESEGPGERRSLTQLASSTHFVNFNRLKGLGPITKWKFRIPVPFPTKQPTDTTPTKQPTTLAPTMGPIVIQCGEYTNSTAVQGMLLDSSTNWGKCESYLSKVSWVSGRITKHLWYTSKPLNSAESVAKRLRTTVSSAYDYAKSSLWRFRGIPKLGKVIKVFIEILERAKRIVDQVHSRLESVSKLIGRLYKAFLKISETFKGLSTAAKKAKTSYGAASEVTKVAIDCTGKTETCEDDSFLEHHASMQKSAVNEHLSASKKCPKTFEDIYKVLKALLDALSDAIFQALIKAVQTLAKALQLIMNEINKILSMVKKYLTKAYCCGVPYSAQVVVRFMGQLMDVATCPADSLRRVVEEAMELVETAMNNMLNMVLRKTLSPVANVAFLVPNITVGSVQPKSCIIEYPSVRSSVVHPFQPWFDALKYDKPSLSSFTGLAKEFGKQIIDDCEKALSSIGSGLTHDCCREFAPLSDGKFCDPTRNIPWKRCSQCTSGKYSFWLDRFHVACGHEPCWNGGRRCGAGTTCKKCCKGWGWKWKGWGKVSGHFCKS